MSAPHSDGGAAGAAPATTDPPDPVATAATGAIAATGSSAAAAGSVTTPSVSAPTPYIECSSSSGLGSIGADGLRVPVLDAPARLSAVLFKHFPAMFPSLRSAKRVVRSRLLLVNNEPGLPHTTVAGGELVTLARPQRLVNRAREIKVASDTRQRDLQAAFPQLLAAARVVLETPELAVVVKPFGITTAPVRPARKSKTPPAHASSPQTAGRDSPVSSGHAFPAADASAAAPTSLPSLKSILPAILDVGAVSARRPQPVHRLDAVTGGLLLCGKTSKAISTLTVAFAERRVLKEYTAIVHGHMLPPAANSGGDGGANNAAMSDTAAPASRTLTTTMGGRAAESVVTVLRHGHWPAAGGAVTEVSLRLCTGRKHQLRKHLSSLGFPIVGDYTYGSPCNPFDAQPLGGGSDVDCVGDDDDEEEVEEDGDGDEGSGSSCYRKAAGQDGADSEQGVAGGGDRADGIATAATAAAATGCLSKSPARVSKHAVRQIALWSTHLAIADFSLDVTVPPPWQTTPFPACVWAE